MSKLGCDMSRAGQKGVISLSSTWKERDRTQRCLQRELGTLSRRCKRRRIICLFSRTSSGILLRRLLLVVLKNNETSRQNSENEEHPAFSPEQKRVLAVGPPSNADRLAWERRGNEERADYVPLLPGVRATSKPGMQLNLQILDVRSTLRGRLYRSPPTFVALWWGYVVTSEVERNDCNLSRVFSGGNVLAESV
jgi:hypothetical protein